jgi:hypothetical protein
MALETMVERVQRDACGWEEKGGDDINGCLLKSGAEGEKNLGSEMMV